MKKFTQKLGKRITAMALVLLMLASSGGASVFAEVAASPAPTAAAETQTTPVPEDTSATATEPTPTEAPAPTETPAATEPAATQEPTEATPEPDQQPTPEPTEEAAATEQPAAAPTEEPAPTASPDPTAAPADNGIAMMNESVEGTTAAAEPAAASQVKLVDIALGDNLYFKLTDSDGNPLTSIGKDQPFKISIEYVIDNLHIGEISADTQIFYEFPEMLDMSLATMTDDITMPGYGIAGSYTLSQNQETQKWELVFSFNEEFLKSRTNIEGTFNWDCKLDTGWWEENETQDVNFGGEGHDVTITIPNIVMDAEKTYDKSKVTETGRISFTIKLNTQGKDVKDVRVVDTLGAAFSWPSDVQISLDGNDEILKKVDKDPAELALREYCIHDEVATINLGNLEAGTYTLTYEAVVNDRMDAIKPGTNTNKVEWHWNGKDEDKTIEVEWTDSTENLTKTASEKVITANDGSKYIEWTIDINGTLPRMDLAGATLKDTLSTDAAGAEQAVKDITLQYQKDDGTWEPVPNAINPDQDGNWSYIFPKVENGENTRHYQVVYRTTLDDSQVKDGNYTSTNRVDLELENEEDYTDSATVEWDVSNAISVKLTGTKTMANNISAPAGTEFTFELYEGKVENFETATPIATQETDADGGDIVFQGLEQLKFTDAGTRNFTIREVADSRTDIGYDPAIWDVRVAVTKNPNGSLYHTITYTKRGTTEQSNDKFSFENTYLETTLDLPVVKKLLVDGGTTKLHGKVEFRFTLTNKANSNEKYTGTATIKKDAIANKEAVSDITWDSLPVYSGISPNGTKTYTYTLAEENSTVSGVTIAGPYTVEVTVTADEKGAPSVASIVITDSDGTEVYDSAASTGDFTIKNTYKENTFTITGNKTLTGADLEDHYSKFSFTVESVNVNGEPITADTDGAKYLGKWTTIKADKTGEINFPTFTVTESGTYYLLVTENELNNNNIVVDQTQYLVKVMVNNNLEATVSYSKREDASRLWTPVSGDADADFANIYQGKDIGTGVTFEGEKTENGVKATRTYKFKLERYLNGERDTSFAAKTITATDGVISFNGSQFGSFNKNDVGNTYYYRLYEDSSAGTPGVVYDDQEYWFAVRVTTYDNGTLKGTLKLEIAQVDRKDGSVPDSEWKEIREGTTFSFTGLDFNNEYYEGSTTIRGTKTVTAVDGTNKPSPSEFTMRLQEVNEKGELVNGGENVTTKPDDNGNFTFTLTYYGPRNEKETRYYMVTEDSGYAQGVTYADNVYYIIVEVENNSDATGNRLDVTWSPAVLQDGVIVKNTAVEKADFLKFENKYSEVTTNFTVSGTKTVEYIYNPHKVTIDKTKFEFVLEEFKNGAWSKVTSAHANADGIYTLSSGDLTYYTEADSPHLFRVREVASGISGITDDTTCYQIAVTVERAKDGYTLTTSKTIQKGTYDADGDFVPKENAKDDGFDAANFTNTFNDNNIPPVVTLDKKKETQSYLDGTIKWSVEVDLSDVNAAAGTQPGQTLQNFTFTDTVGHTGGNTSHPADTTLVKDVAVTCKTHGADCPALPAEKAIKYGADGKTFTIAFGNVAGPHIFIVTYTTKTKPTTEGDNLGQATNGTDITVTNTSSVSYIFDKETETVEDTVEATFKDIFKKKGELATAVVAGDSAKTAIKWTIDLDLSVLTNVTGETVFTITDTLPEGLRYMEGKTTLEQVDPAGETREVEPTDPDSSTLVWNLTGLTNARYQLVYYTEVTGDVYDEEAPSDPVYLTNNAILNQGNTQLGDATDTVKVENKLLSKESKEYTTTGGAKIGLTYTIHVNQDGLDLLPDSDDILTLRDQLPDNATVPTSVTFYRGNTNTLVSDASWRIETENGHNVLVCTLPDETYVRIVYTQVVNNEQPNKPVTLKNTATLTGSYTITAGNDYTFYYAEGAATATGTAGTVSLTKKDSTSVNTRLPGAEFTLYKVEVDNLSRPEEDADGIPKNPIVTAVTKVETVKSNANGVAVFGEGDSGTLAFDTLYYYEETKAPAGYQRNTQRTYFILPSHYTPDQLKTYVGYILASNSDGEFEDELPASAEDVNYPAVTYPSYDVFDNKLESDVQFTVSKQFYGTNASEKSFAFELLNANADGSVNNASGGTTEKVSDETIIRADENGLIPSGTKISIPLDEHGAGTDSFPHIEYEPVFTESKDGGYDPITYYYLIREKDGNKGDAGDAENGELITVNDASVYLVEVKLEYDEAELGGVKETVTMTWMYDGDDDGSYTDDEKQTITPEAGKQPVAAFYNNELQLYSLDGNFVEIQGHKYVKNAADDATQRNAEEGEFRFNLYKYNGDDLANYANATPLATATTDENGNFVFYYSVRDTSQTIELAVVEQNAGKTIDGISYTDQVAKVTLSAKNFADNETPVFAGNFVNTAVLEIEVTKKWVGDEEITDTHPEVQVRLMRSTEGEEPQAVATVTLNEENDWEASFGTQPYFDSEGNKYIYTVEEVPAEGLTPENPLPGYTASVALSTGEPQSGDASDASYVYRFTVTNTFNGAGVVFIDPQITKRVVTADGTDEQVGIAITPNAFKFDLKDENGRVIASAYNDADGNVRFDSADTEELRFDEEDVGKTFRYTIEEDPTYNHDPNYVYDETVVTVEITISRNAEDSSHLEANLTYYEDGQQTDTPELVNTWYPIILRVQKTSKDGSNDPLVGAIYGLWRVSGAANGEDLYLGNCVADENGYMTFYEGVEVGGTYYFKEEFAPDGHTVDEYPSKTFTIREAEDGSGYYLEYQDSNRLAKNAPAPEQSEVATVDETAQGIVLEYKDGAVGVQDEVTKLYVNKLDTNTREPVTGAVLQIIEKDTGTVVYQWTSGETTQGMERVLNVDTTYILREVTAPDGYDKAEDTEFIFDAYGNLTVLSGADAEWVGDTTINLYNTKRDVTITRQVTDEVVRQVRQVAHVVRTIPQTGDGAPIVLVASLSLCGVLLIVYLQERKRANRKDR